MTQTFQYTFIGYDLNDNLVDVKYRDVTQPNPLPADEQNIMAAMIKDTMDKRVVVVESTYHTVE